MASVMLRLPIFVLIIIGIIIILLLLLRRGRITIVDRFSFWKRLGVAAYVRPFFYWRHMTSVIFGNGHLTQVFDSLYKRFPRERYVGYYEYARPCLLIRDPKLIGRILSKDFYAFQSCGAKTDEKLDPFYRNIVNLRGCRWKTVRNKVNPSFSSSTKLNQLYESIEKCARDLDDYLAINVGGNDDDDESLLDVKEPLAKYVIDVVGSALFGMEFNALKDPNSEYRSIMGKIGSPSLCGTMKKVVRLFVDPNVLILLRTKAVPEFVENFIVNFWSALVAHRKVNDIVKDDFAQAMIDWSTKDRSSPYYDDGEGADCKKNLNDEEELQITDDLILANVYIFYVGGFSTTAVTLGYVFYELALNSDVQTKLRDEINETIDDYDGVGNYQAFCKIKYLDMIIYETMRLHSTVPFTYRECDEAYQIPDSSIVIPKGTRVTIPIHSIHNDADYYPEPDKFIPERFSDEEKAGRPPYTFLAFGAGPRICVAWKLAMLEMKLCLFRIIPKYKFSICPKTIVPIRLKPRSILHAANHDITLSVTKLFRS